MLARCHHGRYHEQAYSTAKAYGREGDYVFGANVAGSSRLLKQ